MRALLPLLAATCLADLVEAHRNSSKVALKSEEDLQEEVRKLKVENSRLRGLLGNGTQKNSATAATTSQDKKTVPAQRASVSANQTSFKNNTKSAATGSQGKNTGPANHTSATSEKNVQPAVDAVNHALDMAVHKPNKTVNDLEQARARANATHESTRAKLRASIKALDRVEMDIAKLEHKNTSASKNDVAVEAHKFFGGLSDSEKDEALEKEEEKVLNQYKKNSLRNKKIMRQLVAPPAETMKPMIKTFKDMIAKLEKLNKHDGDESRMLFCEEIAKDLKSCEEPFKDHEGITYKEHSASECLGVRGPLDVEVKSDSEEECQTKCNDLGPDCAGYLHMTSGPDAGKCFFKKGGIKDVKTSDKSTCFEKEDPRDPLVKKFVALNLWVLEQASTEIDWICQSGFRSSREENRVDAFRLVVKTYVDGIQCQPGDIPCPGGTITGEKPTCECVKDGK